MALRIADEISLSKLLLSEIGKLVHFDLIGFLSFFVSSIVVVDKFKVFLPDGCSVGFFKGRVLFAIGSFPVTEQFIMV